MRPQDGRSSAVEAVFSSPSPLSPTGPPCLSHQQSYSSLSYSLIPGRAEPSTGSSKIPWQTCLPRLRPPLGVFEQIPVPSSGKHAAPSAAHLVLPELLLYSTPAHPFPCLSPL